MRVDKRFIRILLQFLGDYRLDDDAFRSKHGLSGEARQLSTLSDVDKERIKHRMKTHINVRMQAESGTVRRFRRWHYAAASVAVLICLAGGWYVMQDRTEVPFSVVADLEPGRDRAQLILADGTTISLDKHQEGLLATQGGVQIRQNDTGSVVYSGGNASDKSQLNQLVVPRGGRYTIRLPDGTDVWLNADSRLTYPTHFYGAKRQVELVGEAYFEVAHDATRPFEVKVGAAKVEVLGTRFNIRAYDGQPLETALLEGAVAFNHGTGSRLLKPGERAVVDREGKLSVLPANPEKVLAWKAGYFYFENTPIRDIMEELGRWYDADIDYVGDLGDLRFGGMVSKAERISTILDIMARTDQLTFQIAHSTEKGRRVTVMKK